MNLLAIILGMVGPWQIILIVAIVLLLFGGKKIPELMKGLGKGMKEFKDATNGNDSDENKKDETAGTEESGKDRRREERRRQANAENSATEPRRSKRKEKRS